MSETKNFIVNLHGRGASYCGMAPNSTLEDLLERCQHAVNCGFEVFVYSIEPSQIGQPGFMPPNVMNLRRHAHLYDATDEYTDEVNSIINGLSVHSVQASEKYLNLIIEKLTKERDSLAAEARTYDEEEKQHAKVDQQATSEVRENVEGKAQEQGPS